ncbi:tetratricopeptide repeat protein [Sphingorhabdus sp.]|uniref:tetratricopeptide repeat protein n=1 Tax=Sphingorhabdus sp. TaxID=1902408 RepID=UPI0038FD3770
MTETVETSKISRVLLFGALVIFIIAIAIGASRNFGSASEPTAPTGRNGIDVNTAGPDAVIASLEERTRKDPTDVEAWQLLGWSYFENGRYLDSANAYGKATKLEPARAVYWSSLGESLVMADERNPMPKAAKAAFDKAIILDPKDPRSRYFLAVSKDLDGDHKGAINDWLELLKDTPKDAPWESDLIRTIEQVGKIHKVDVTESLASTQKKRASDLSGILKSIAAAPIPGPSKTDMAQAAKLPPGQQQQMVTSMVEGLETKLANNPKNVDGWIMLMRSRMTLGETAKAKAALTKSIAANPEAQSKLLKEAQILGVPGT